VPTEEEIKKIIELYNNGNGLSQGQIAKEVNKGKSTVHRVLKGLGVLSGTDSERAGTKNANIAKTRWDNVRILELNNRFLEIVQERIEKNPSGSDLKSLATTYAIMIDKRKIIEPPAPLQIEDDGFMSALENKTVEAWQDAQDIPVQMYRYKPSTVENLNLVGQEFSDS
jgi:hypothetical protein